MTKKLFIKTYGCQMNVYDSERMEDAMVKAGYESTDSQDEADMILLNTCHIREKAAEKVYSELGRFKKLREEKPDLLIGVAGCVAQAEGEEIMLRQPMVNLVVGPQTYHRLPELVAKASNGERAIDTDFPLEDKFAHIPNPKRLSRAPAAFLTVQEGCDKFCAFCVVPYTRGSEVSRTVERLLTEARNLVDQGVVEINLLGQNVNAYHGAGPDGTEWGLARLIRKIAEIEGLERIRYTTSHPRDMEDDLIAAHGDVAKLMPYLHLPVQAGSDKILKAMNRGHTAESYLKLIERIKAGRPDLALSGDFIVGFPGETEADFQDTLNLVNEVQYAQAYSFKYSQRPGTPAAGAKDQVDPDVAQDRLERLQAALGESQAKFQNACVGLTMPVLIEKPGKHAGQMVGRSPYLQPVHLDCPSELRGQIVDVVIDSVSRISLGGTMVKSAA